MATFDYKEFVDNLIEHNGWTDENDHDEPDNPRAALIVEYTNSFGVVCWGVTFVTDIDIAKYLLPTYYVRNPKIIWNSVEHPL